MKVNETTNLQNGELFNDILQMIYSAKQRAEYQVNTTIIDLYWLLCIRTCCK